ncbi:unnamed protein product [Brassica oleracea]|uniref:(rape) hypothetical protein n=1 Tax=Brassica napus TaxID=3708 RepID=A0A816M7Q6_BRANA|nr:unnamed protein product [Brassica napus]
MTENLAAENERMNDVAKIKVVVYREAVDPLNFQRINATCLAYRQTVFKGYPKVGAQCIQTQLFGINHIGSSPVCDLSYKAVVCFLVVEIRNAQERFNVYRVDYSGLLLLEVQTLCQLSKERTKERYQKSKECQKVIILLQLRVPYK